MPAANFDFEIEQGSDFQIVFRYFDENSNPVNLKNNYILLRALDNNGVSYEYDNVTKTNDYSLRADEDGFITFNIPAKITDTYLFTSAEYELDIQEPNEVFIGAGTKSNRILFGNITVVARLLDPPTRSDLTIFPADEKLCPPVMLADAVVYNGGSLTIADDTVVSSSISVLDNRNIQNIELEISGLNHTNIQDLNIFLKHSSMSNTILLVGSQKFANYMPGFSFIISDRAHQDTSAYNVMHGGMFKPLDKTNYIKFKIPILGSSGSGSGSGSGTGDTIIGYQEQNLIYSFDSLIGNSANGDWTLYVCDHDPYGIGFIHSWKLYITYEDLFQ